MVLWHIHSMTKMYACLMPGQFLPMLFRLGAGISLVLADLACMTDAGSTPTPTLAWHHRPSDPCKKPPLPPPCWWAPAGRCRPSEGRRQHKDEARDGRAGHWPAAEPPPAAAPAGRKYWLTAKSCEHRPVIKLAVSPEPAQRPTSLQLGNSAADHPSPGR